MGMCEWEERMGWGYMGGCEWEAVHTVHMYVMYVLPAFFDMTARLLGPCQTFCRGPRLCTRRRE